MRKTLLISILQFACWWCLKTTVYKKFVTKQNVCEVVLFLIIEYFTVICFSGFPIISPLQYLVRIDNFLLVKKVASIMLDCAVGNENELPFINELCINKFQILLPLFFSLLCFSFSSR